MYTYIHGPVLCIRRMIGCYITNTIIMPLLHILYALLACCGDMAEKAIELSFITWNIDHGSKKVEDTETQAGAKPEASYRGYSEIRSFFVNKFFTSFSQTSLPLACLQEVGNMRPLSGCELEKEINCTVVKGCHAGVAVPKCVGKWKVERADLPAMEIPTKYKIDAHDQFEYIKGRYCGDIVTLKDEKDGKVFREFILVSYHASNEGSSDRKREKLISFFKFMCDVADEYKKTIIVGGDFNLSVDKWKLDDEASLKGRVEVAKKYEMSNRRAGKDLIDTFVVIYPKDKASAMQISLDSHPVVVDFFLEGSREKKKSDVRVLLKKLMTF